MPNDADNNTNLVSRIEAELINCQNIDRVIKVTIFDIDGNTKIIGAKISLPAQLPMTQVSVAVALAERRIERLVPEAKHIFVTPDVFYDADGIAPSTSTIVTLSYD